MTSKILIVEDEKAIAFDLKFTVESLDFVVTGIANNYEDAIRQAISTEPDLALIDIHIKGVRTGIDAARTFRDNFDIPVIFLTSSIDSDVISKAIETEPLAYLVKPVRKDDLLTNIGLAMANHERAKALRSQLENISSAIHSIETPLIITGTDRKINYLNKSAELLCGFSFGEIKQHDAATLISIPGTKTEEFFKTACEGKTILPLPADSALHIRKDGDIKIMGSISPFTDQEGNPSGFLLSIQKFSKDIKPSAPAADSALQDKDATFLSDEYFFIKDKGQMYRVNLNDINYIEALGDYIMVHTDAKRFTTLMTMKKLEQTLSSEKFARVHRSYIIAVDKISSINSNDMDVYIGDKRIPIGETYKQELLKKIKIL